MKYVAASARYLLGAIFLFFGTNMLFNFLHQPLPSGVAGQYFGALAASHMLYAIGLIQILGALLLLANRFVPFALVLLAAMIFNIDMVHILLAPEGLPIAALVTLLWILIFWHVRSAFAGIFQAKVGD
jgi:putative oxidoreductase